MKLLREYIRESLKENQDLNRATVWVDFIKSLSTDEERPITYKSKQKKGSRCCWCGRTGDPNTAFVGVEHIIPRGAGGPVVELWNLAWACYPCNKKRGSDIGNISYQWLKQFLEGLNITSEPNGWLFKAMLTAPLIPAKEELKIYFKQNNRTIR